MGYAILWIEALMAALLWVAASAAFIGRLPWRLLRVAFLALAMSVPLSLLAFPTWVAGHLKFQEHFALNWFNYAVSLSIAWLVGAVVIVLVGRVARYGARPAARNWPRGKLTCTWLAASLAWAGTLWEMDMAVLARLHSIEASARAELLASEPVIPSDSKNAAVAYRKVFDLMDNDPALSSDKTLIGVDDVDIQAPATAAWVNGRAPIVEALRQASSIPYCRFEIVMFGSWEQSMQWTRPLNWSRQAAQLLELDAKWQLSRGRTASGVADINAVFRIARHLEQQDSEVFVIVGWGVEARAREVLQSLLSSGGLQHDLDSLHLIVPSGLGTDTWRGIHGDYCSDWPEIQDTAGVLEFGLNPDPFRRRTPGLVESLPSDILEPVTGVFPVSAACRVFFLPVALDEFPRITKQYEDAVKNPGYQSISPMKELTRSAAGNKASLEVFGVWFEAEPSLIRAELVTMAKRECTQTTVATTRYRLDHGTLPTHLEQLVPAYMERVPIDPFDGHPLCLVVKQNKWIIYSIGPDEKDDGGVEMEGGKGDITFTLTQPAPATRP